MSVAFLQPWSGSARAAVVGSERLLLASTVVVALVASALSASPCPAQDAIRPWQEDPRFWEHRGRPVLLVGGSGDDNLFQMPEVEKHLDAMVAVGANYVRNTMSDRPDKGFEVYPFRQLPSGKYDLAQWNDEYWDRFDRFLRATAERGIIVQIELWDRFDYADSRSTNWTLHPYNPKNNVNYTAAESGLKHTYRQHPNNNENPFFRAVPTLENNEVVLPYQQAQIDKLLSYSLAHSHVLYCIDNETSAAPEWPEYWAMRIRQRAEEAGVEVYITEMWDQWDPKGEHHRRTFDHPERYTFVDISQNNHNRGQAHWDNLQWVRDYLARHPRPLNTVKIYGADTGRFGNSRDGAERFWRNLLGGAAGTRFHRPDAGLGLSEQARAHIRSFRMLEAEFEFFGAVPDASSERLHSREPNEAYLSVHPDHRYAVYFPNGGQVELALAQQDADYRVRWLDILHSRWSEAKSAAVESALALACPGGGHWVALVELAE